MPWFGGLIPADALWLARLDLLLDVLHAALVTFVVTGWAIRPLRRAHLFFLTLVWTSWIALGFYVGNLGYCILTDWHWQVKAQLGETGLPASYLKYAYQHATGHDVADRVVSLVAASVLILSTGLSSWLNCHPGGSRDPRSSSALPE